MSDALIPLVSNPRGCFGSHVFIIQDAIPGVLSRFGFGETAFVLVEVSPPCPNSLLTEVKEHLTSAAAPTVVKLRRSISISMTIIAIVLRQSLG